MGTVETSSVVHCDAVIGSDVKVGPFCVIGGARIGSLVGKGLLKVENFRRSQSKLAYAYQLTPRRIAAKARITRRFLESKRHEYKTLRDQIAALEAELRAESRTRNVNRMVI